jgi:hypothetical protein
MLISTTATAAGFTFSTDHGDRAYLYARDIAGWEPIDHFRFLHTALSDKLKVFTFRQRARYTSGPAIRIGGYSGWQ